MAQADLERPPVIPLVPSDLGNARATNVRFAAMLNQVLRGAIGATMGVTLAPNATNSTFSDSRIGPYSSLHLMPATAHAADLLPTCSVETSKGFVMIHHGNVPYVDLTYVVCLIG